MAAKLDVLIIDDDKAIIDSLSSLYKSSGYAPVGARTGNLALELARNDQFDLIVLDLGLPDIDGLELLRQLKASKVTAPVIIVSGQATISKAIEATRLGAFNVIEKPPDPEQLMLESRIATRQRELEQEVVQLRRSLRSQNELIGQSKSILQLREKLSRVAATESRICIYGEPGSGKEMAARFLHYSSPRAAGPMVAVNCAAIPSELFESELFGHERGAFTGAVASRQGKFEQAHGGTLFLDEVAELRPEHQAKLLRAIETSQFQRLGSSKEIRVDVRIVSASNKDLQKETAAGRFREDLFFRLNVIPITVPPLRQRTEDIPLLTRHFLDSLGYGHLRLEPAAVVTLSSYEWPGNVRELRNIVERAAALKLGDTLTERDISEALSGAVSSERIRPRAPGPLSLREHNERFESALLQQIMRECDGNITKAARSLKMDRGNLSKKLKRYAIRFGEQNGPKP